LEFSGFVSGEIGGCGALEAPDPVDGGVDLGIRKNEPVPGWGVLRASHFAEFQERGSFLHCCFVLRPAGGLERLQDGEVFLD
jgi:hypothetical protein